jgi:hypothetical protein
VSFDDPLHRGRRGAEQLRVLCDAGRAMERQQLGHPVEPQPHRSAGQHSDRRVLPVDHTQNSSGAYQPLAERWNGSSWAIQPIPNPTGATFSLMTGLSCPSTSICVAVGYYVNSSGIQVTLAERWNGASWAVKSTPNPAAARATC